MATGPAAASNSPQTQLLTITPLLSAMTDGGAALMMANGLGNGNRAGSLSSSSS
jgi:hypothetical protein